jgi:hypothetical protein
MTAAQERREHPRFHVRWKAATLLGQWHIREIHHGHTLDLSLGGVCILCDHGDWNGAEEILIYLFPHASRPGHKSQPIELCGKIVHVIPSCGIRATQLKVEFTDYRDDAKDRLSALLSADSELVAG